LKRCSGKPARSVLRGMKAAPANDGIFAAVFLPMRIVVAEIYIDADAMQRATAGELGVIVEGDRLATGRSRIDRLAPFWDRCATMGVGRRSGCNAEPKAGPSTNRKTHR